MDEKSGKIFGHKIPLEVYFEVLDKLNIKDLNFESSLALLNLSRTSSVNAKILRVWAAKAGGKEVRIIRTLQDKYEIPCCGRSYLAILCRLRGGLCISCNNRAKLFPMDENMMGLQLCRACEVTYFPKISLARINETYVINEDIVQNQSIKQLLIATDCRSYQIKGGVVYYDWKDVHHHIVETKMVKLSPHFDPVSISIRTLTNEDFGIFYPPNQRCSVFFGGRWPRQIIWDEICAMEGLERTAQRTLAPYQVEMFSLNYFRYLFDPKWRDDMSKEQKFIESMTIIRKWGSEDLWDRRPWATKKIPVKFPARCSKALLMPSPTVIRRDVRFGRHQAVCDKLRFFMRFVPEIQSNPKLNIKSQCNAGLNLLTPRTSNSVATSARRKSPAGGISEDFDMEIFKYDEDMDVKFVRRGDQLDFMACPLEERPFHEGDVSRTDIISFRGGNVSIRSRCMVDRFSCFTGVNLIDGTLSTFGWMPCRCSWCFIH